MKKFQQVRVGRLEVSDDVNVDMVGDPDVFVEARISGRPAQSTSVASSTREHTFEEALRINGETGDQLIVRVMDEDAMSDPDQIEAQTFELSADDLEKDPLELSFGDIEQLELYFDEDPETTFQDENPRK